MDVRQTYEFAKWMKRLHDANAKARILLRIKRIEVTDNLGDVKPVGDGVFELRIDYGPGYRVYFTSKGDTVVLLLLGGDKSTQRYDIEKAKMLNVQYE